MYTVVSIRADRVACMVACGFRCWNIFSTWCAQQTKLCNGGLRLLWRTCVHLMTSAPYSLRIVVRILWILWMNATCCEDKCVGELGNLWKCLQWIESFWMLWTGMEVLLEMLSAFVIPKHQRDGSLALCTLAKKANALSPIDAAPLPPTPQVVWLWILSPPTCVYMETGYRGSAFWWARWIGESTI